MKVTSFLFLIVIFLTALFLPFNAPVLAADISKGAKIFEQNCAGCHPHGGNIIRRAKNLKKKALYKNKMDSLEAISSLVTNGKNNMSAFQDRLSLSEIEAVSKYVLEQAERNWQQ